MRCLAFYGGVYIKYRKNIANLYKKYYTENYRIKEKDSR
jgi:hypothetical protein